MWYYHINNQQTGPVDEDTIKSLLGSSTVTAGTLMWQTGMEKWLPLAQTQLASLLPAGAPPMVNVPPPVNPSPAAAPSLFTPAPTAEAEAQRLNALFKWYWISMVIGLPLCLLIIGIFGVIASVVFMCFLLHSCWRIIQDGEARTTPDKSVGFIFIPFFNFYWLSFLA